MTEELDAVTVGQYTSSGEIFTENSKGIGKFVRETIFLGYNMAVSFIGGENRSSRRKQPTCRNSLTNFIT
jgi:hypothetical protein